ncbi:hypothetical protein BH10ACI2_BH10ACI2_07070 [soil metagenome]
MNSYIQLFLRGIKPGPNNVNSQVIAFTSAVSGEGVSYVTESFATDLAGRTKKMTVITDVDTLKKVDIFHYQQLPRYCCKTDIPFLHVLKSDGDQLDGFEQNQALSLSAAGSELDQGISNLQTLRHMFDYVLVDCPSIKESGDAAYFASAVDGVVLVVSSQNTRKEQVRNALNTIEMAEANVLGCVLNKRCYPIPNWIYRRI